MLGGSSRNVLETGAHSSGRPPGVTGPTPSRRKDQGLFARHLLVTRHWTRRHVLCHLPCPVSEPSPPVHWRRGGCLHKDGDWSPVTWGYHRRDIGRNGLAYEKRGPVSLKRASAGCCQQPTAPHCYIVTVFARCGYNYDNDKKNKVIIIIFLPRRSHLLTF